MQIIGGKFKGRRLESPATRHTRPTAARAREALFSILTAMEDIDWESAHIADFCAGTGAFGFEALSRGAEFCLFIDNDAPSCARIRRTAATLDITTHTRIYRADITRLPLYDGSAFDILFIDAPYGKGLAQKALTAAIQKKYIGAQTLMIVEDACRSKFEPPSEFRITDRRAYGNTEFIFLRV